MPTQLIFFLILASFICYSLSKKNSFISLLQTSFSNYHTEGLFLNRDNTPYKDSVNDSKQINGLKIKSAQNSKLVKQNTALLRKELSSNLKHLEFILTIENQLADLAFKDRYTVEKLEEYIRIKKEVQLKVITLSQAIFNNQSQKRQLPFVA